MLTATQKNQIINTYAKALTDILMSSSNCNSEFEDLQKVSNELKTVNNLIVTPDILKSYKNIICKISSETDKNSSIQCFLLTILKRRYGFLLPEIVKSVKAKLKNELNQAEFCVYSCKELSDDVKKNIQNTINSQIGNSEIEFKINKNITDDSIDFISNGKICSLNLQKFLKNFISGF